MTEISSATDINTLKINTPTADNSTQNEIIDYSENIPAYEPTDIEKQAAKNRLGMVALGTIALAGTGLGVYGLYKSHKNNKIIKELDKTKSNLDEQIKKLTEEDAIKAEKIKSLEEEIASLKEKAEEYKNKIINLTNNGKNFEKEIETLKEAKAKIKENLDTLTKCIKNLEKDYSQNWYTKIKNYFSNLFGCKK